MKKISACLPLEKNSPMARRFASKALHLAQSVYLSLGTPKALECLGLSLRGEHLALLEMTIEPSAYKTADAFRYDYLAVSLMSKFPGFSLGTDRDSVALASFLAAECSCAATNKRLSQRYVNGVYSRITPESIIWSARGKIARLLGPFNWDEAEPSFAFGPGATFSRPKREGDSYYKFKAKPCVTSGCAILALTAIRRVPRWFQHVVALAGLDPEQVSEVPADVLASKLFDYVPGNRVTFVPKDAKKSRSIAIEPTMNGFIQHGIGDMIRRRLRRAHVSGVTSPRIDLDDQVRNQELARIGSRDGSLATLDLSAASDSVSMKLVEALVPPDWFEAICLCRSERGILPSGEIITYQKVSSMGNGFTFELESLIFWALCRAVVDLLGLSDRRVSVYGDDLIIPVGAVPTVRWILQYCGFTCNESKSFSVGPFRESCGKHYFLGTDVTPFYVREDVDSASRVIWFANQVRRWSISYWGLDSSLRPTYDLAVSMLPRKLQRPSIPNDFGDGALWGDLDEVTPRRCRNGIDGWVCDMWLRVIRTSEFADVPFLLRQISGRSVTGLLDIENHFASLRGGLVFMKRRNMEFATDVYRVKSRYATPRWRHLKNVPVANWPSFGPWLDS